MDEPLKRRLKGYGYLSATVLLYVLSPFVVRILYYNKNAHYNKPFFVGYFCTIMYLLYAIPYIIGKWVGPKSEDPPTTATDVDCVLVLSDNEVKTSKEAPLTDWKLMKVSTLLGIVSVLHAYAYNLGVQNTSVVSNFIIHDTSDVFVFIFCMCFLNWKFSWYKIGAIAISVMGVLTIGYSDTKDTQQPSPIFGDFCSVISTLSYALLLTLTKMYIPDEDSLDWNLFFLYTGISMAIVWLPFLIFLHLTGIETFEWPNRWALGLLCIEGLFGYVLGDYALSLATVLLDPLIADLGLGLLSPLSMLIDHYYEGKTYDWVYCLGYGFILIAFVMIVLYDVYYEDVPPERHRIASGSSPLRHRSN